MDIVRSSDGTPIAMFRSGAGSPLVLVHGGTADHTRWAPVLPAFERHFAVCAVDRRGRGKSGDSEPYDIRREFEDIAAVIDSLGEPVDLLGHSFGAVCALEAALLTRNIRKLVLYEPPPLGAAATLPPETAARMQQQLDAGDRDGAIQTFLVEVARVPADQVALMRSLPAWEGRVAAAHTILREGRAIESMRFDAGRYASLPVPTLLLLGGDSPGGYRDSVEAIRATLPDCRLVVMAGQQHIAMNTAPDLFAREVLSFLQDSP